MVWTVYLWYRVKVYLLQKVMEFNNMSFCYFSFACWVIAGMRYFWLDCVKCSKVISYVIYNYTRFGWCRTIVLVDMINECNRGWSHSGRCGSNCIKPLENIFSMYSFVLTWVPNYTKSVFTSPIKFLIFGIYLVHRIIYIDWKYIHIFFRLRIRSIYEELYKLVHVCEKSRHYIR